MLHAQGVSVVIYGALCNQACYYYARRTQCSILEERGRRELMPVPPSPRRGLRDEGCPQVITITIIIIITRRQASFPSLSYRLLVSVIQSRRIPSKIPD